MFKLLHNALLSLRKHIQWKDLQYHLPLIIVVGYFIYRGLDLVFTLLPGIPADEKFHVDLIELYSHRLGMIKVEDVGEIGFGIVIDAPNFYHFVLGKLLWLNVLPIPDFQFLRLINLILASATVLFSYKVARLLLKDRIMALFVIGILTNIPQFSFLATGVSYDNLINLLSIIGFYYIIQLIKNVNKERILKLFMVLLIGVLTKMAFAPLAVLYIVSLIIIVVRKSSFTTVRKVLFTKKNKVLSLFVLILMLVAVNLYVGNLFKYGRVVPSCTQILSYERCELTRFDKPPDSIDHHESVQFGEYVSVWPSYMIFNMFTHGAHMVVNPNYFVYLIFQYVALGLAVLLLVQIRKWPIEIYLSVLISVVYTIILATSVYVIQFSTGEYYVLGRYLFPVLIPILVSFVWALGIIKRSKTRYIILGVLLFILVVFDYPHFKSKATSEWTIKGYQSIHDQYVPYESFDYLEDGVHDRLE